MCNFASDDSCFFDYPQMSHHQLLSPLQRIAYLRNSDTLTFLLILFLCLALSRSVVIVIYSIARNDSWHERKEPAHMTTYDSVHCFGPSQTKCHEVSSVTDFYGEGLSSPLPLCSRLRANKDPMGIFNCKCRSALYTATLQLHV